MHEPAPAKSPALGRRRWRLRRRRPSKKQTPKRWAIGAVTEVGIITLLALTISLILKTFLVQAFFIPSVSMENTLLTGDRLLVNKLTPSRFELHRGDIVVFEDPGGWLPTHPDVDEGPLRKGVRDALTFVGLVPQDSGEHLIKRVIGLPGDKVSCEGPGAPVKVNGAAIAEPYLFAGDDPSAEAFSVTVPADRLWVMGDHRSLSEDSRAHVSLTQGTVAVDDVVGKAFVIIWPVRRGSVLDVPDSVFAQVPPPG